MYATPAFITEALCYVTYVQLIKTAFKVKVMAYKVLAYSY